MGGVIAVRDDIAAQLGAARSEVVVRIGVRERAQRRAAGGLVGDARQPIRGIVDLHADNQDGDARCASRWRYGRQCAGSYPRF